MQPGSRRYFPKTLLVALGLIFLYEVLYITVLDQWLGQWSLFRQHLPGLFFLALALLATLVSYYEYHGIGPQEGIVRQGANRPVVALTFDDGPSPKYTPQILDVLREKRVPATFFMVGKHVEKYPEVARRVVAEGHEVGNHTFTHRDLVPAARKTVLNEVTKTDEALMNVAGIRTRLFRPPRGIIGNAVRQLLVEMGYTIVLWNVSAFDWGGMSARVLAKRVRRHTRNGSVVLLHDSGALLRTEGGRRGNTVEALPLIIDELRQRGFQFVSLSSMLLELQPGRELRLMEFLPHAPLGQEA